MERANLYSSGEFARLNAVSKKTLRVYEEMGLLQPEAIDESNGYRFYSLDQCSTLDAIQQIQNLGASLTEIKSMLDAGDLSALERLVGARQASLDEEMLRLRLAKYDAEMLLRRCRQVNRAIIHDTVIFEQRPAHYALTFPILNERAADLTGLPGREYLREWELNLRLTKQYMLDHDLPLELFRNVGCMISRENLLAGRIELSGSFIFIDDEYLAERFGAERLSDGTCLVMYKNSYLTPEGDNSEVDGVRALLAFAAATNLDIVGDYYGEIIADTPAFLYQGREMLYKLQVRVETKR